MDAGWIVKANSSTCTIDLRDGHVATLLAGTTVEAMDANDYAPPAAITDAHLRLLRGGLHITGKGVRIKIKTNGASLGLYGSDFYVTESGGSDATTTFQVVDSDPLLNKPPFPAIYWLGDALSKYRQVPTGSLATLKEQNGMITVVASPD